MADRLSRNTVFTELINQWAGQNEVKELVDLANHRTLGGLLPGRPPEDGENLYSG